MKKNILMLLSALPFFILLSSVSLESIYDKIPDIANSFEGVLKKSEKDKALDCLNAIRKLHGLLPVEYNEKGDIFTARASLIMTANNTLTHNPSENMKCWSKEGAAGAGQSNLAINYYSDQSMIPTTESFFDLWLKDTDVESLGHRRWLLDPFLKSVSFGRVDGKPLVPSQYYVSASALLVVNTEQNDITDMKNDFVAYPYGIYPAGLFDSSWYLSFSIIADKKNKWNNRAVSFQNAGIEIRDDKDKKLIISGKKTDYTGFGLSNILMWKTSGLKPGIMYSVTITGAEVNGTKKDYNYSFTIAVK